MKKSKKVLYRNLIVLIVAIILLIIIGIVVTMARYRSTGTTSTEAEVAFYVLEEGFQGENIMLSGLYPREEAFEYNFTVSNTVANEEGTNIVSEVSLDYNMELKMTTNLPLEVDIYKNGTKLTSADDIENNIILDESGQCYIRKINIKSGSFTFNQSKTDTYTLSAKFPTSYKANQEYQSIIDIASIVLESKQKIN